MGGLRTRDELLNAWRAEAELAAAAVNERAEAEAAAALDAALRSGAPVTPDMVVRLWARDALCVELRPADPVPLAVWVAFRRAQAGLWDGARLSDPRVLVDEPARADDQD